MATTTNYGWTTPDDTALVKDGASAIRTLGSSVDTTTKNLNPETTLGDISFRSSTSNVNTRIGIGSSGQHLTVVAGVPAWATASDQTPLTTKGDLLGFSTLDARIPIGANGTLLTADSTESLGLKWAAPAGGGPATLITSASFTGQSSVAINGCFTSTYTDYYVLWYATGSVADADFEMQFQYSTSTTETATYFGAGFSVDRGNTQGSYGYQNVSAAVIYNDLATATPASFGVINFVDVGNASAYPTFYGNGFGQQGTQTISYGGFNNTTRLYTGFLFKPTSGTITGRYKVYGVNN
jgi:hypothetical protein